MISQNIVSQAIDSTELAYQDCVIKSGIDPVAFIQNLEPASGLPIYDLFFRNKDTTTNSDSSGGSSLEASRNLAHCIGDPGYLYKGKFYLPSDLAGDMKAARFGSIKSEGEYWAGVPVSGWIVRSTGRLRQLAGPPIGFSKKKSKGFDLTTEFWEPRRYHQPKGKPLSFFFPTVSVGLWEAVAEKAGLAMPAFFELGLIDPQFAKFIFCNNPIVSAALLMCGDASKFWEWVEYTNCPVIFTEGEKKALALISRGYAAIGLPGINTGYRVTERGETVTKSDGTTYDRAIARELHEALQKFDTPGREITILFDYRDGDYSESQEFRAAITTAKLLKSAIAKIAQLPGPDKGVDDFCVAGGDVDGVIVLAEGMKSLQEKIRKQQTEGLWRSYRRFTPDRIINQKFFEMEKPQSGTITAGKSGLGTGKTEELKKKVASDTTGTQINLVCRNSLGLQLAEKLGSYHLDAHDGYAVFLDPDARLTLCVDSLLKIPLERLEGCTLIIDESASVIKHLLSSGTLFSNRLEVLERFELACKVADRIVLTDGNQADWVVNYIAKLAGNKAVLKIENQFQGDTPPVTFLKPPLNEEGKPQYKKFFEGYASQILASGCPAVATDSLQQAEALAKRLTEELGEGILLTSKTVTKEWAKEMLKCPDDYIEASQPAWLVYTPTAEMGVDISIKRYFSDMFCWFAGVLGVDELMQMSRRVRNPIGKIYIFCAERGLDTSKDGDATYYKQISDNIVSRVKTEAILLTDDEALTKATVEAITQQATSSHHITYCKIRGKDNLERRDLRGYLFKAFAASGYAPELKIGTTEEGELHKRAKEECRDLACQEIFNAEDIDWRQAEEIEREYSASWPDRCKVLKFRLLEKFPGLEKAEFWEWEFVRRVIYEERDLRSQLEAAWLFHNPEDAEYLQRDKWQSPFQTFLPDVSARWLKLRAIRELNIEQFLDTEKVWTQDSPEVQEFIKLCKKKAVANLLGYPGKYPMQYINKLLGLIGVRLVGEQVRSGPNDEREWQYRYQAEPTYRLTKKGLVRVCSLPELWDKLSAFTATRMAQKVASLKQAEMLASKELEFVTDMPLNNIKMGVSVTKLEPEPELEPQLEPIGRMGWVNHWGEWVRASFLATTDGAQYRMLIEKVGKVWDETLADPDQIRWDSAPC